MAKPGPLCNDPGPRGVRCPKCMHPLNMHRGPMDTQPAPGGTWRKRSCARCRTEIETIEHAVGQPAEFLDVSDLDQKVIIHLRGIVRSMREAAELARRAPLMIEGSFRVQEDPQTHMAPPAIEGRA